MLIESSRHTPADLRHWREVCEQRDAITACRLGTRLDFRVRQAMATLAAFIEAEPGGYLGVSWGKDSVVCAWLLHRLEQERGLSLPVVWAMLDNGLQNPDSPLVRDVFLERWPLRSYHEIVAPEGETRSGTKEERLIHAFAEASRRFGNRYASGLRADESVVRRMSIGHRGLTTKRTCRPIGGWKTPEVFALIRRESLPLHPAYACTRGGLLERDQLRTANIGGFRGTGHGRGEWERTYYPDEYALSRRENRMESTSKGGHSVGTEEP